MNWILTQDLTVFRQVNFEWANPVLDWLMPVISNVALMKWPIMVVALILLVWGGFRGRIYVGLVLLCVAIGDPLIINGIKHSVERPRPYQALENVRHVDLKQGAPEVVMISDKPGVHRSMPSGHTANTTVFAIVALLIYGWRLGWLLLAPLLMMYSRVYTGDHFPTDTLVAFLLSGVYTLLICCIANKVWQKCGRRFAPKVYGEHSSLFKARRTA